jgi:phospholipid transport system transporter-binding protein
MKQISLDGELTFKTVMDKRESFLKAIESHQGKALMVSMMSIKKADSAGLALMLEGVRYAKRHQVELAFQHVPKQLASIATFCCVDDLLGFSKRDS